MRLLFSFVCVHLATGLAAAQQAAEPARALTADDYRRAERFMNYSVAPLVLGGVVRPTWLDGDRFWFRNTTEQGSEFVLVDAATGSRRPAFNHEKLAAALSDAAGTRYESRRLPFQTFEISPDGRSISLNVARRRFTCDVEGATCVAEAPDQAPPQAAAPPGPPVRTDVLSPDRRLAAFIRNDNLWIRDVATRQETQLTTDGAKDYGYATDNAGWRRSTAPIVAWSPDSKKMATFRQDQRGVGEMYLVETKVGRPTLQAWKYPLPGDATVATIERVVVHVDGPRVVPFKMAPDQHRSTVCDDLACRGEWGDVQWSPDSTRLAFASVSRDHKEVVLREADAATGAVRDVLEEKVKTFFESGNGRVSWRYLPASSEVIWFSQRDNWGHLYLYDLKTGQLKNRITSGEGNVAQLLYVDEKSRTLLFVGNGRDPGRDPYFRHLYRVGLDGQRLALLTPEDADHEVSVSRSGRFFTDSYSTPDVPPVSVVRDLTGRTVATIEKADISKLLATGWTPPMRFTVKARDGVTDLYGLLFRPSGFDPARKYPVVNNIYPGPQQGSVGSRSFSAARGDTQALAELGFVVVQIDAMGTPGRSKAFHDAYYGNMGDNGLPDQVAGMKELAARFPWIDVDRAGIYGHSGGGYAAAGAMFRYPDFFKVGVSQAGNHDNRNYEDDWGEKWQGLLQANGDGTTNYDNQANQLVAKNLKGRLLLAHGMLDNNVPPSNTLLVVDELIKANKDFDLILFPNRAHGFGSEPYMVRRRWDYFVRHLLGAEPPREYELKPSGGPQAPTS
jgi:dipeptidyl aminopeptidase/acylaminoacyl peptidase